MIIFQFLIISPIIPISEATNYSGIITQFDVDKSTITVNIDANYSTDTERISVPSNSVIHDVSFNISLLTDTGDGRPIAAEAGAAMSEVCAFCGYGYSFKTRVNFRHEHFPPFTVLVNKRGQRYIDESAHDIGANALVQQPGKITYGLLDPRIRYQ